MRLLIGGNTYGFGNIGDDAALAGIVKALDAVKPDIELWIESRHGNQLPFIERPHNGIRAGDWKAFKRALGRVDAFIVGGGTTIGEELSLEFPLVHVARRVSLAAQKGCPVLMLGGGANRIRSEKSRRIAGGIIKASTFVASRDPASAAECRSLGDTTGTRVQDYADPAFLLEPQVTERIEKEIGRLKRHGMTIGINMVNEAWAENYSYKTDVAEACNRIHAETGAVPVFFCNEIRTSRYFDLSANLEVANLLDCPHEVLYPEYYTPQEMLALIGSFTAVFSVRMHPLIFAASVGTPFDGISRIDKMDNLFDLFGRAAACSIDSATATAIYVALHRLLTVPTESASKLDNIRAKVLASARDSLDILQSKPLSRRCPLELLRYAPGISKLQKLRRYLTYGRNGIEEMLVQW